MTRYLVIGDVHGENAELHNLLRQHEGQYDRVIFLGDLVDRGPDSGAVVMQVEALRQQGLLEALVVGNHDHKLFRAFMGRSVRLAADAIRSVEQINAHGVRDLFVSLCMSSQAYVTHRIGFHVFVHAAPSRCHYGHEYRSENYTSFSNKVGAHAHAMYGYTTGRKTPEGFPERLMDWIEEIPPKFTVWKGHDFLFEDVRIDQNGRGGRVVYMDTGAGKAAGTGRLSGRIVEI